MLGLGMLTIVLVEGRTMPTGWTAGLGLVAVAGLSAFVASQRRAAAPMLPLDLFRSRRLNAALTATFTMTFATYGLLLVNSFAFQQQRGATTMATALCFLPLPVAYLTVIPIANALANRIGPRSPMAAGLRLIAAGLFLYAAVGPHAELWLLELSLLLAGAGLALNTGPAVGLAMSAVPIARTGLASGVVNLARLVGITVGVAVLGSAMAAVDGGAGVRARADDRRLGFGVGRRRGAAVGTDETSRPTTEGGLPCVTLAELPTRGDADIAAVASLLADPARCKVMLALDDGRALPASVLADEAGISRSTASSHLGKLTDAGLLSVETHGRHRYYRLAGPEVGELLEHLVRLAPPRPVRSLREGTRAARLRSARTCYDHLAGRLGVQIMGSLLDREVLSAATVATTRSRDSTTAQQPRARRLYELTEAAETSSRYRNRVANGPKATGAVLRRLDRTASPFVRRVGASGAQPHLSAGWVKRVPRGRAVTVTDDGQTALADVFGIDWTD